MWRYDTLCNLMLGFDQEFHKYFNVARELDWTGLDLWVYGGIVSGWRTDDIDATIIGPVGLHGALLKASGPWDICYQAEWPNWSPGDPQIKQRVQRTDGTWVYYKLPTPKINWRQKHGYIYKPAIQLIKNGVIQL
jgi:hypothetical protein